MQYIRTFTREYYGPLAITVSGGWEFSVRKVSDVRYVEIRKDDGARRQRQRGRGMGATDEDLGLGSDSGYVVVAISALWQSLSAGFALGLGERHQYDRVSCVRMLIYMRRKVC